jgi:hypothetical protein
MEICQNGGGIGGDVERCTYVRGAFLVKHIPSESLYIGATTIREQ